MYYRAVACTNRNRGRGTCLQPVFAEYNISRATFSIADRACVSRPRQILQPAIRPGTTPSARVSHVIYRVIETCVTFMPLYHCKYSK